MDNQKEHFKGLLPPPILFFALVFTGFVGQWLFPVSLMFQPWLVRLLIGLPVLTVSGLIALKAIRIMRKNKTAINFNKPTTTFIRQGPFCFSRNPLYLSLLMVMASISIMANSAWHALSLLLLFLFFHFMVVAREENYLESRFGEEYVQYKNQVRRWI